MDTDELFQQLLEQTQNTLQHYCRTLNVTDDVFLTLINRCLLSNSYDIFETLLKEKVHHIYDSKPVANSPQSKSIKAALLSGHAAWVKRLCEVSVHLSNKAAVAIWECRKFEVLQSCFPRISAGRMVLTSYTFQRLMDLSLQDECPQECLHYFDELLFKDRPREILQILPNKSVNFMHHVNSRSDFRKWAHWCLEHDYGYAAVYILLLVQDFFETFEDIMELCFAKISDHKLRDLTALSLYLGLRSDRDDRDKVTKALVELYEKNDHLDNLFHLMEEVLETAEWEVLTEHLIEWCDVRGLRKFKILSLIKAEHWERVEGVLFSDSDSDSDINLVDYALIKIPYVTLRSLWSSPYQWFVMQLLAQSSQKEVIMGNMLLRAVLNNDLVMIHRSLNAYPEFTSSRLFGDLDSDFLSPLFTGREAGNSGQWEFDGYKRDMAILLVRSGLLHQYRFWLLNKHFPECRSRGCQDCEYCGVMFFLYTDTVVRNHSILKVFLRSGFMPHRLLFQLRDSVPVHREGGCTPFAEMLEEFVNGPYSLQTLCAAEISFCIGCHSGRIERIQQLKIPEPLKDRVAFEHGGFKLSTEKKTT